VIDGYGDHNLAQSISTFDRIDLRITPSAWSHLCSVQLDRIRFPRSFAEVAVSGFQIAAYQCFPSLRCALLDLIFKALPRIAFNAVFARARGTSSEQQYNTDDSDSGQTIRVRQENTSVQTTGKGHDETF